jgi:hypothetical protein
LITVQHPDQVHRQLLAIVAKNREGRPDRAVGERRNPPAPDFHRRGEHSAALRHFGMGAAAAEEARTGVVMRLATPVVRRQDALGIARDLQRARGHEFELVDVQSANMPAEPRRDIH